MESYNANHHYFIAIFVHNNSKVNPPFSSFNEGGKYATLAAIVGITHKKQPQTDDENYNDNGNNNDDDDGPLLDYMGLCPVDNDEQENDFIVPMSSSVRLVGVGRAILRKFFYQVPSELCNDDDEEGGDDDANTSFYYENQSKASEDEECDEYDEYETNINLSANGGYEDSTPIVMARFQPLVDDTSTFTPADPDQVGEKGQRSYRSSPVHGKIV